MSLPPDHLQLVSTRVAVLLLKSPASTVTSLRLLPPASPPILIVARLSLFSSPQKIDDPRKTNMAEPAPHDLASRLR